MKKLALFAAHFTPSNLAAVHRARLWAQHLPEFGWEPTIVTTHHRHYEEQLDWDLHALVPASLRVVRTPALPTKPVRVVGDIGVRGLTFHYHALSRMAERGELDFLHITIPSNFSAVLGRMIKQRHGIPYGIDYIDPWVHEWSGSEQRFSKAWTSARLAELLEPWAVREAALVTGVAPLYFEAVLQRNPHLRAQAVTAAMPYGGSELDFERLRDNPRPTFLFDRDDGLHHVVYAGAMLPRAYAVLERLFEGLRLLRRRSPDVAARLRLHFVGTGKSPNDPTGYNIKPYIERAELSALVDEHPSRIPYVDVLNHLIHASSNLILGSTEAHYTPSKAFQAVLAKRPLLALLHEASTAADFLARANAATVVTFGDAELPSPSLLAEHVQRMIEHDDYDAGRVNWQLLEAFSARSSARVLAEALDRAYARHAPGNGRPARGAGLR